MEKWFNSSFSWIIYRYSNTTASALIYWLDLQEMNLCILTVATMLLASFLQTTTGVIKLSKTSNTLTKDRYRTVAGTILRE
mmetsp:Transcript_2101/g.3303  ORF Transcript_2101/g.3303 Transcript_2101/m.3303 type:complete len:81 (-) Transcript_2101:198-440(-)